MCRGSGKGEWSRGKGVEKKKVRRCLVKGCGCLGKREVERGKGLKREGKEVCG